MGVAFLNLEQFIYREENSTNTDKNRRAVAIFFFTKKWFIHPNCELYTMSSTQTLINTKYQTFNWFTVSLNTIYSKKCDENMGDNKRFYWFRVKNPRFFLNNINAVHQFKLIIEFNCSLNMCDPNAICNII